MIRSAIPLALVLATTALPIATAPQEAMGQDSRYRLSHALVVDQYGTEMRFSPDAIGDRVVVVGFTWLGCRTVCPITDQIMKLTERRLTEQGRSIRLITLTLDPLGDPPRRMAARAKEFEAGRNWLWLSGGYNQMRQVLSGLDAIEPDLAAHPPAFLVIDGRHKIVARLDGTPRPEEIIAKVDELLAARG